MKSNKLNIENSDYLKLSSCDMVYIYGGTEPGDPEDENNGLVINLGSCPTWGDCKSACSR